MKRRIVITGMGIVSPIGNTIEDFSENLRQGVCGEGEICSFDASRFPVKRAFEVKNFNPHPYGTHLLDPFIQYAVAACDQAFKDAAFQPEAVDPYRVGISVSSSKGGVHTIDRFKERFFKNPSAILGARIYANSVPNFAAQWIARKWKLKGAAKCYVAACATGTVSVAEGAQMICDGVVDYCVAGASDASITPLMMAGYHNMKALSPDGVRPFDKHRKGFMVGEGAGIVFLETYESAKARKARIYGEIFGWAYGSDSTHALAFDPSEDALVRTLKLLWERTNVSAEDLHYINLHGTATEQGDIYETQQLKKALGKTAERISTSSTKSMTGHMLGASGTVEIIASLLAMNKGFIPPTLGLTKPDPACDLDYTPNYSKEAKVDLALSVSMGFGGHVAVILLGKS